jgi:hypothetical protein
VVRNKTHLVD